MGSDDDFGSDIQLDDELEGILATVEARHSTPGTPAAQDIEELVPRPAPIQEFRKKGWLSVSDLVGTVWCEVQVSRLKVSRSSVVSLLILQYD
jgi:exonuclease V